ncbi:ArsR/SmtB family transcription factor [Actinokineospora inagensis]|uniref:ArsR/SmtB family transcription factor n=1 Tax=Actinokineospora inagensis TaxID=103730 RepID=UPI0004039BCC|nr:winged helix-turn-helix domain-containing protein [Actinokineospora inagensis]
MVVVEATKDEATVLGDAEISAIGGLLADRARCRVLMALGDGRALPASVLADEAGVSRSTASSHLGKLTDAGLLLVETHGRHRYYRLAGRHVGELLEKLTQIAPAQPVRSLRDGNRAAHLRAARTCYDHLAGRLGVAVMTSLLRRDLLTGGDGTVDAHDPIAGYGRDAEYTVTEAGWAFLGDIGVRVPDGTRRLVRYCVDWSEQRHHLAGRLGRSLLDRFLDQGWLAHRDRSRSVKVTDAGTAVLAEKFDITWKT